MSTDVRPDGLQRSDNPQRAASDGIGSTNREAYALSPADLVNGPCALPDAPLDMPQQVIETARGFLHRIVSPDATGRASGIGG